MAVKNLILIALLINSIFTFASTDRFSKVEIKAKQIRDNIYMLTGSGGNIGVLAGTDGILLVDDQFEPLAHKIEQAVFRLTEDKQKVKYVVNTHYHGDHTGSNVYFSKSASVIAHENVRKRLSVKSKKGLPVITYQGGVKLHLNKQTIDVQHLSAGHTDGDSVVYFQQANVWHLGDLLFESRFPYVDKKAGGTVKGMINNLTELMNRMDANSIVIPGHGQLTDKHGIAKQIAMIKATQQEVVKMKENGLTMQQSVEQGLSDKWKDWSWSFITEEKWIKTLY